MGSAPATGKRGRLVGHALHLQDIGYLSVLLCSEDIYLGIDLRCRSCVLFCLHNLALSYTDPCQLQERPRQTGATLRIQKAQTPQRVEVSLGLRQATRHFREDCSSRVKQILVVRCEPHPSIRQLQSSFVVLVVLLQNPSQIVKNPYILGELFEQFLVELSSALDLTHRVVGHGQSQASLQRLRPPCCVVFQEFGAFLLELRRVERPKDRRRTPARRQILLFGLDVSLTNVDKIWQSLLRHA